MKNIGITQCIIPLQSGDGHIPIFDQDFSISKLKRMFSVDCFVDPLKELKIDYYKIVSKDLKSIQINSEGKIEGYPTLKINLYTIDSWVYDSKIPKIVESFSMKFYDEKMWDGKEPFYFEDWNGKTTLRGLFGSKPVDEVYKEILDSCEKGKTVKVE